MTSLGRFDNRPITVGSYNHKKVEERRNDVWQTLDDFPVVSGYIYGYSMVNFKTDLYLFGLFHLTIGNSVLFIFINNIFKAVTAMANT